MSFTLSSGGALRPGVDAILSRRDETIVTWRFADVVEMTVAIAIFVSSVRFLVHTPSVWSLAPELSAWEDGTSAILLHHFAFVSAANEGRIRWCRPITDQIAPVV